MRRSTSAAVLSSSWGPGFSTAKWTPTLRKLYFKKKSRIYYLSHHRIPCHHESSSLPRNNGNFSCGIFLQNIFCRKFCGTLLQCTSVYSIYKTANTDQQMLNMIFFQRILLSKDEWLNRLECQPSKCLMHFLNLCSKHQQSVLQWVLTKAIYLPNPRIYH